MGTREVVNAFWDAMHANDWEAAAARFSDDVVIDWPCSGERIRSPAAWAQLQARYPAAGTWRFDVHRLLVAGSAAVSEVTVTDGEQAARLVAFSDLADELIRRQVEYWPTAYEPASWRADLVERIPSL